MKQYQLGEIVTVDLMTGRFEGRVNGFTTSLSGEQLYKISGDRPKHFITTTSARLINVARTIRMFTPEEREQINKDW